MDKTPKTKYFRIVASVIVLLGICLLWYVNSPADLTEESREKDLASVADDISNTSDDINAQPEGGATSTKSELDSQFDELEGYGVSPKGVRGDLELVQNLIFAFHTYVKKDGELPTAGNRELMQAMLGENAYKMRFVHDDFKFLNENGEIIDRWGQPLTFHFEKYGFPEIRSSGPDGKVWTSDDVMVAFE